MPIATSRLHVGHQQRGGRAYVTEVHTDSAGVVHVFEYLSDIGSNHAQTMADRAVALDTVLADSEVEHMLAGWAANDRLTYQTAPQAAARLRERYRISSGDETVVLAEKILQFMENGIFKKSEMRGAFDMNTVEWTAFELKLSTHKNNRDYSRAAKGE